MDTIANMLTSIRNAQASKQETVSIPYSNIKYEIAKILERNKLVEKVEKKGKKTKKTIDMNLRYEDKLPIMSGLKRISKPGQRIYLDYKKIRKVKAGFGMAIISTSKGLMTDREAKKQKVGGEILCEIW